MTTTHASARSVEREVAHYDAASVGMRDYAVFGGRLRSEIDFPELVRSPGEHPDWTFRVSSRQPPATRVELVGERRLGSEHYRLSRADAGFRLEYSHAGTFDISADGATIVWYRRDGAPLELVRAIVLGSALALALELAGLLCLHGSAVVIRNRAIAFLGPKHYGKSTLATALTAAGARLLGDDLLALQPGPPATLRPGVEGVRLWSDAARALAVETLCDTVIEGVKTTAAGFGGAVQALRDVPLAAVYVLEPTRADDIIVSVERERLSAVAAAVALAHQTKLPDSLIGLRAAGLQLAAAVATAATVPVWKLRTVRDFGLLPTIVKRILQWHAEEQW